MGTLGAGNHYAEVQVVDQIFDEKNAEALGIGKKGQVCIMIHSGSRGLGHQVHCPCIPWEGDLNFRVGKNSLCFLQPFARFTYVWTMCPAGSAQASVLSQSPGTLKADKE